jgi:hypothetical protein
MAKEGVGVVNRSRGSSGSGNVSDDSGTHSDDDSGYGGGLHHPIQIQIRIHPAIPYSEERSKEYPLEMPTNQVGLLVKPGCPC